MADYILRGGEVIDGSGRARFRADVAIKGDRIAEIGAVVASGKRARGGCVGQDRRAGLYRCAHP